jgi:hypothetical protein
MGPKKLGWERTILLIVMTYMVLTGISYTLGVTFRTTIPWRFIPALSLAVGLGFRILKSGAGRTWMCSLQGPRAVLYFGRRNEGSMMSGRAQPRVAAFLLRAHTQAQLVAVLVSGLLAFLMLELLPCGGTACFGMRPESAITRSGQALLASPVASTSDLPAPLPLHQAECALNHAHCSELITAAPMFAAVLTLVALLRAGPPLTIPTWTVAPPLPPP